jgi:hypothetical protein
VEQLVRQLTRIEGVAPPRRRRRTMSLVFGVIALATMALVWYVLRPSKDELTRPAATETSPRTVEPEQPLANPPLQPPIVVAKPEAKPEPARTTTGAKPAAPKPKPPKVELDGMWEEDPADARGGGARGSS